MSEYIRDGHRLYLQFHPTGEVTGGLRCPVPEKRGAKGGQPPCHTELSEDGTVEYIDHCNIRTWFENGVLGDYLHTEETFNITRVPVPIEWAFVNENLHIRPYDPTANLPAA